MITGFYVVNDELGSFTKETQRRVIRAIEEALDAGDCCLSIGTLKWRPDGQSHLFYEARVKEVILLA